MNTDNLEKWLNDLETTTDPQTRFALTRSRGDCCLGRLCKVSMDNGVELDVDADEYGRVTYDGEDTVPPKRVLDWLGVEYTTDSVIAMGMRLNDTNRLSFREIAAAIRKNYA